ncbi:MAG: YggT family protein [Candidatus Paceibacterota bacterium]
MDVVYTDPGHKGVRPLYRGTQIVWYLFSLIEALLIFRFLLKLIGANPNAVFTDIIYTVSYPFAAPFLYVVRSTQVSGSIFEWTTLLAMLVYWVVAWGIVRLFIMGKPVSRTEAEVKLQAQDVA